MSSDRGDIILTVDVEDNFTRNELVNPSDWEIYEKQAVENTRKVISFLKEHNSNATFFVLGRLAERHPTIVKEIIDAGYELASHGYAHIPVGEMTPEEFEYDVKKSIEVLEDISNKKINCFRARSFSITSQTAWAFDILKSLGISCDSSCYDFEFEKLVALGKGDWNGIKEFSVATSIFFNKRVTMMGGIIFRLLPISILKNIYSNPNLKFLMIYSHVWEFNKDQPRRKIGLLQKVAQSPLIYTTESKLRHLALSYKFVSISQKMDLYN
jgi:polysaccharide deacetylase family protein (PEP-CTERM system associated)